MFLKLMVYFVEIENLDGSTESVVNCMGCGNCIITPTANRIKLYFILILTKCEKLFLVKVTSY